MDNVDDVINVVYTVNIQGGGAAMFVNQLVTSVKSIIKSRDEKDKINIFILVKYLPEDAIKTLLTLSTTEDVQIKMMQLNDSDMEFMQQFTSNDPNSGVRTWSGIVFARLWIPFYVKGIDKCIYLDSDTLVRKSLSELWHFDLKGKTLGMAMGSVFEYGFNSGVMLMDLSKMNNDSNWKKLHRFMSKNAIKFMLPDQTVINRYYKGQIVELPKKFNYGPNTDRCLTEECMNATIWHFYNGGTKPTVFNEADWCKVEWNRCFSDI